MKSISKVFTYSVLTLGLVPTLVLAPGILGAKESTRGPVVEKAPACNAGGFYCEGSFGDVIQYLDIHSSNEVWITLTPGVVNAINSASFCVLANSSQILVEVDGDGGEERMVSQLLQGGSSGRKIALRFVPRAGDDQCLLLYTRNF